MSGEQQDKQRAIEVATKAGLHNDGTDDTWGGNPTAFKGRGIYVEAHIGDQLTSLRAAVPNDTLQALLHPVTADRVEEAVVKVRAAIDDRKNGWGKTGSDAGHQALNMLLRTLYAPATDANPG